MRQQSSAPNRATGTRNFIATWAVIAPMRTCCCTAAITAHPPRDPAHAAIESPPQLLLVITETLRHLRQQPALFQGRCLLAGAHRAVQKQCLGLAQRPDHRFDGVAPKLFQRPDPPVAVDE
jgi:hypothetical protein